VDKHFPLKNSRFDLLALLYDQRDNLLLQQLLLRKVGCVLKKPLSFSV